MKPEATFKMCYENISSRGKKIHMISHKYTATNLKRQILKVLVWFIVSINCERLSAPFSSTCWTLIFLLSVECMCHSAGTVPQACSSTDDCQCDQLTGQCPCQPNVVGQNCDRCTADTWNITSGTGCQLCDCDPVHSSGSSCNEASHCDETQIV